MPVHPATMDTISQLNATKGPEVQTYPPVDTWFLMYSPYPVICILVFYLYFVTKLGPQIMQYKEPYKLKGVIFVYNAYQVVFNFWMVTNIVRIEHGLEILLDCTIENANRATIVTIGWWFFFSKAVDLLDTVFFVLRKKQSQVTFLHVYHHFIMVAFTWAYVKYFPDGQGGFMALVNSFVHVVMYIYYLLAGLGPEYQKYLWWKKYMTWLQLLQFSVVMVYLGYIIVHDCQVPTGVLYFYVINNIVFISLFLDFYRKAYKEKQAKHLAEEKLLSKMQ